MNTHSILKFSAMRGSRALIAAPAALAVGLSLLAVATPANASTTGGGGGPCTAPVVTTSQIAINGAKAVVKGDSCGDRIRVRLHCIWEAANSDPLGAPANGSFTVYGPALSSAGTSSANCGFYDGMDGYGWQEYVGGKWVTKHNYGN